MRSLIRVQAERTGPRGRRQRSVRYYVSSQPMDATALLELVRGHWGVENSLHCTLQFRETNRRIRRYGHPAPDRPEHDAHGSKESQILCFHWPAARPYRPPALDLGPMPALNPTLRLTCQHARVRNRHRGLESTAAVPSCRLLGSSSTIKLL